MIRLQDIRTSQLKFIFITLVLIATWATPWIGVNSDYVIAQASEVSGTWKGDMFGTEKVSEERFIDITYELTFSSTLSGTFDGDKSNGKWNGEYLLDYTITPVNIEGQEEGIIEGDYAINIDESGSVSGEAKGNLSGILTGTFQFQIKGSTTDGDHLTGTWTGFIMTETIAYGGTPVPAPVKMEGSGDFEGTILGQESPTPTQTTPIEPTTPTEPTTPIEPTTPTQTPTPAPHVQTTDQYILYAILAILVIIILAGIYAYKIKHKEKT